MNTFSRVKFFKPKDDCQYTSTTAVEAVCVSYTQFWQTAVNDSKASRVN